MNASPPHYKTGNYFYGQVFNDSITLQLSSPSKCSLARYSQLKKNIARKCFKLLVYLRRTKPNRNFLIKRKKIEIFIGSNKNIKNRKIQFNAKISITTKYICRPMHILYILISCKYYLKVSSLFCFKKKKKRRILKLIYIGG